MLQQEAALRDLAGAVLQDTTSLHGQTKRASGAEAFSGCRQRALPAAGNPGFIEALSFVSFPTVEALQQLSPRRVLEQAFSSEFSSE